MDEISLPLLQSVDIAAAIDDGEESDFEGFEKDTAE